MPTGCMQTKLARVGLLRRQSVPATQHILICQNFELRIQSARTKNVKFEGFDSVLWLPP